MKSGMLSIASSSPRHRSGPPAPPDGHGRAQAAEAPEDGKEKGRHLKSVDAEEAETEPTDSEAEVEMGANAAAPTWLGCRSKRARKHEAAPPPRLRPRRGWSRPRPTTRPSGPTCTSCGATRS